MGILHIQGKQFVDVIDYVDKDGKLLVVKYQRPNDELKQGARVIVREGQCAVFMKGGVLGDIMGPGTYRLTTDNLPILSTLAAFPHGFNSPIKADVYFVNVRQFTDHLWGTRNPVMIRDSDFGMVRVRAFGRFAFRIQDVALFSREVLAARHLFMTYDIVEYLSGIINECIASTLADEETPALDFATHYHRFGNLIAQGANATTADLGIQITQAIVENVSLPDEVEKLIDEQSGIAMAKKDMSGFLEYQNARALRDAARQEGGLAGLGAGIALGETMAGRISTSLSEQTQDDFPSDSVTQKLREFKALFDEGILSREEFEATKKKLMEL